MKILLLLMFLFACGSDEQDSNENLEVAPIEDVGEDVPKAEDPAEKPAELEPAIPIGDVIQDGLPELVPCENPIEWKAEGATFKGCRESKRVLTVANGTNARCGFYQSVIDWGAKKGYMVVCPNTGWTGTGMPTVKAIEYLLAIGFDVQHVRQTGHSQGGASTVGSARILMKNYPEIPNDLVAIYPYWPMTPYFTDRAPKIPGRKIVVCGKLDTTSTCSGVYSGYRLFKEPKEFYTFEGSHLWPHRQWIALLDRLD